MKAIATTAMRRHGHAVELAPECRNEGQRGKKVGRAGEDDAVADRVRDRDRAVDVENASGLASWQS